MLPEHFIHGADPSRAPSLNCIDVADTPHPAQLLPLVRWPDLDSHLNLIDDPFMGLPLNDDRLSAPPGAGLGIDLQGDIADVER